MAMVFTGASGNINPPIVGVSPEQMQRWGRQVADSVLPALAIAPVEPSGKPLLKVAAAHVSLPLESCTATDIANYADRCLADPNGHREFGEKYRLAVETWRAGMTARAAANGGSELGIELIAVALGSVVFIVVNAEVFSQFNDLVATGDGRRIYAVGCTNGMVGYLPTVAAYKEGGYEVQWAMLFYNGFRLKPGSLELVAEEARRLVRLSSP